MALTIEANYSKKVGLPGYSSHQFSLSLKAEITDLNQVPAEAARLYRLLQDGVDTSIKEVGWLPEPKPANGNGHSNGHTNGNSNGNSHPRNGNGNGAQRRCRGGDSLPLRRAGWFALSAGLPRRAP